MDDNQDIKEVREVLKAKFRAQGMDLRDDNCLYKNGELVASDVRVIDLGNDCLTFEMDVPPEFVEVIEDDSLKLKPVVMH